MTDRNCTSAEVPRHHLTRRSLLALPPLVTVAAVVAAPAAPAVAGPATESAGTVECLADLWGA